MKRRILAAGGGALSTVVLLVLLVLVLHAQPAVAQAAGDGTAAPTGATATASRR